MQETKLYDYREIDINDIRMGKQLGRGAFGQVFKGEYRGAAVAVKTFDSVQLDHTDDKVVHELRMEAHMMQKLSNHPNIVHFVGAVTKGQGMNFVLVLEYCAHGSLHDLLIKKKKKLPLLVIVGMARDAALGILHLHKEQVIHRDIAARNVLVGKNYEVYVSDFGLARIKSPANDNTTKQTFGPVAWMAPEALSKKAYSEATDAFSFGVLLWEMMARKMPWHGMTSSQIVMAVSQNNRLKIPKDCDPVFRDLIKACWEQSPSKRPTFQQIADRLSKYYKSLKRIHGVPEIRDDDDSDSDGDIENVLMSSSLDGNRPFPLQKQILLRLVEDVAEQDMAEVKLCLTAIAKRRMKQNRDQCKYEACKYDDGEQNLYSLDVNGRYSGSMLSLEDSSSAEQDEPVIPWRSDSIDYYSSIDRYSSSLE